MKRWHWIIAAILVLAFVFLGIENFGAYMLEHGYYKNMLANNKHRGMIIKGIFFSAIPLVYIFFSKKLKRKSIFRSMFIALVLFGLSHVGLKGEIISSGGGLMFIINCLVIFTLMVYFLVSLLAVGSWINQKLTRFEDKSLTEMLLIFGMGLGAYLLINHFLLITNLFYPVVLWILFIGGGVALYFQKDYVKEYTDKVLGVLGKFHKTHLKKKHIYRLLFALLLLSILYFQYGFQLSFIPYPTAWDANHAYMFFPKVRAENAGYYRQNGPANSPYLWYSYIAFWFGLFKPLGNGWLAPDTIAIMMNFLSGIFVLLFGLGSIQEVKKRFTFGNNEEEVTNKDDDVLRTGLGWFMTLLWLTSGMGAFLVFVDNKTDLGVMALILLAILAGFVFLNHINTKSSTHRAKNKILRYLFTSGFFFALAIMAKPSAFIDAVIFLLILLGLGVGVLVMLGVTAVIVGLMTKIQVLGIGTYFEERIRKRFLIGAVLVLPETIINRKKIKQRAYYIVLRGVTVGGIIFLVKTPHIVYGNIVRDRGFEPRQLLNQYLMGVANTTERQIDTSKLVVTNSPAISVRETQLSYDQCSIQSLNVDSVDDLYDRMREVPNNTAEDLGRYVGFDQRTFTDPSTRDQSKRQTYGFVRLGYPLLRLLFPRDNYCYTSNKLAKQLCMHKDDIVSRNEQKLTEIADKFSEKSHYRTYLLDIIGQVNEGSVFDTVAANQINTYRRSKTVETEKEAIKVPYRFLVPLNIVYNRSLQNHSSYYTDIGFFWFLCYILLIVGLIYSIVKRNRKLLVFVLATLVGWFIWYVIAHAILWYGMGLIFWTILASMLVLLELKKELDKLPYNNTIFYLVLIPFSIWGVVQLVFNFSRITSQGAGGPFIYYKQTIGKDTMISAQGNQIRTQLEIIKPYSRKTVFNRQFGHYNPLINITKDRADTEGIWIAGTYAQYFLENQLNIEYDGLVTDLRRYMSDNDACASYLRIKNNNKKFIALDPNIATVVMGEGNKSLFYRFFMKQDEQGNIIDNGVISMIAHLVMNGYLTLEHSNNLGIKYAFSLDSASMQGIMSQLGVNDEAAMRTMFAGLRFFRQSTNQLAGAVTSIFAQRIPNGQAVSDIADIYGKVIDTQRVLTAAQTHSAQNPQFVTHFEDLTEDEKFVFLQYANLLAIYKGDNARFQQEAAKIVQRSLGGGSQIMVFELRE